MCVAFRDSEMKRWREFDWRDWRRGGGGAREEAEKSKKERRGWKVRFRSALPSFLCLSIPYHHPNVPQTGEQAGR